MARTKTVLTRTKTIGIRISEEETSAFEKRAQELGICVSELIRQSARHVTGLPSTVAGRERPSWWEDASRVFDDAFFEDMQRSRDEARKAFEARQAAKEEVTTKKQKPQPLNKKGSKS